MLVHAWLVLVLLAGMSTARQLVLCVAPGQHVSVEAQHLGLACAATDVMGEAQAEFTADSANDPSADHCSDIPLLVRSATMAGGIDHQVDALQVSIPIADGLQVGHLSLRRPLSLYRRAPHPHLVPLGTVVLQS